MRMLIILKGVRNYIHAPRREWVRSDTSTAIYPYSDVARKNAAGRLESARRCVSKDVALQVGDASDTRAGFRA